MDEARYIDWYDVVQAVANGRSDGLACPECGVSGLESSADGITVRVRCPACGQGFSGRLAHGRDDALHAEAAALVERSGRRETAPSSPVDRAAIVAGGLCATGPDIEAVALTAAVTAPAAAPRPPVEERPEPWSWTLPAGSGDDVDALSQWMPVVESIHNGRGLGLHCPFCSEPLTDITHREPYIRVRCGVCGEAFEGRLG